MKRYIKHYALRKKNIIIVATFFSFFLLCIYSCLLAVPVISDETTTMANAAWLFGYDWSWMIAALGGYYYRFGQAFLTVPIFAIFDDPHMIYRFCMILQSLIQASIIPIVYIILRRHLMVKSQLIATFIGTAVCLVPSMVLYTFYYRGDFLLGVLPWYVLLLFLEIISAIENGKKIGRLKNTFLIAFFTIFAYAAHTRGIIVFIALVLNCFIIKNHLEKDIYSLEFILYISRHICLQ